MKCLLKSPKMVELVHPNSEKTKHVQMEGAFWTPPYGFLHLVFICNKIKYFIKYLKYPLLNAFIKYL